MKLTYFLLPALALSAAIQERTPSESDLTLHTHDARAATLCGSGYTLDKAVPLPKGVDPDKRKATLFAYSNNGKGCVFLDNNVGKKQYMSIKVCKVGGKNCDSDTGSFSQYAGPVYVSSFACAPVTAKMGSSSSNLYVNYKNDYVFPCN
ncbi:uncharacterized protein ANIA_03218 [Aspergillus nidulans FGSC A4]|jgi:hypothetical protein|uniref:AA1-like domain-containing protein n=1 Tax=Emericella nidulans (strain FGSC A4 / ATCC 38163 / CBS 112.46 / NRRL 194 / M139) TaxID=227321 RepID=C8VI88_EMENI|nr:hypothetical protein [Aspergillus nidulans FGSC A4]CBF83162.1 TPA: conserved hypothetical protein [Aspergillus nidulans FGSC A4]